MHETCLIIRYTLCHIGTVVLMSIGFMSPASFKKMLCRGVKFKDQGPPGLTEPETFYQGRADRSGEGNEVVGKNIPRPSCRGLFPL